MEAASCHSEKNEITQLFIMHKTLSKNIFNWMQIKITLIKMLHLLLLIEYLIIAQTGTLPCIILHFTLELFYSQSGLLYHHTIQQ